MIAAAVVVAGTGTLVFAMNAADDGSSLATSGEYITEEAAKQIALEDAGVAENELTGIHIKFDQDLIGAEYEIDFRVGAHEYEYEIDAKSGAVISREHDIDDDRKDGASAPAEETSAGDEQPSVSEPSKGEVVTPPAGEASKPEDLLSEDEAKAIVLEHAKVNGADAVFEKTELERDDGRWEYEIDFRTENAEYDYELNAATGEIIKYEIDEKKTNGVAITEADAKRIALEHAKVGESELVDFQIELDRDDGSPDYEIEFRVGRTEYEYEIDASTGDILDFEIDKDD